MYELFSVCIGFARNENENSFLGVKLSTENFVKLIIETISHTYKKPIFSRFTHGIDFLTGITYTSL